MSNRAVALRRMASGLADALRHVTNLWPPFARLLWLTVFVAGIALAQAGPAGAVSGFAGTVDAYSGTAVADRDLSGAELMPQATGPVLQEEVDGAGDDMLATLASDGIEGNFPAAVAAPIAWRAIAPATVAAGARAPPARS